MPRPHARARRAREAARGRGTVAAAPAARAPADADADGPAGDPSGAAPAVVAPAAASGAPAPGRAVSLPRRERGPRRLILLNKPFDVLCQFTREGDRACLADFVDVPDVYPAGRLDRDSEGLIVLTNDGGLQRRVSEPRFKMVKTYLVQVEGEPDDAAIAALAAGVRLNDGPCAPCRAKRIDEPDWLWPRDPPIRFRANIPTSWLSVSLTEGRNRQVRRMTAAVGHPTLRLIRWRIGPWALERLAPGQWREVPVPGGVPVADPKEETGLRTGS